MALPLRTILCLGCNKVRTHYGKGFCHICYSLSWYHQNKERARQNKRKWKREHPEAVLAERRRYEAKHGDTVRAARRTRQTRWRKLNPVKFREQNQQTRRRRLAREKGVIATLTRDQWLAIQKAYNHQCAYCGKKANRLTQDHVIPLSKGGNYTADNIVPACQSCNSRKGTEAVDSPPPTRLMF